MQVTQGPSPASGLAAVPTGVWVITLGGAGAYLFFANGGAGALGDLLGTATDVVDTAAGVVNDVLHGVGTVLAPVGDYADRWLAIVVRGQSSTGYDFDNAADKILGR